MATVAALDGCRRVGRVFEDSLIGREYLRTTRKACRDAGLTITAEVAIPQLEREKRTAAAAPAADKPDAIMHVGFGLGIIGMNAALSDVGCDAAALHHDSIRSSPRPGSGGVSSSRGGSGSISTTNVTRPGRRFSTDSSRPTAAVRSTSSRSTPMTWVG